MASNTICPGVDSPAGLLIQAALEQLDSAKGELILDFSVVHRLDPAALRGMEELAAKAQRNSVKVGLRGVHTEVYKVLKLVALVSQFSFDSRP